MTEDQKCGLFYLPQLRISFIQKVASQLLKKVAFRINLAKGKCSQKFFAKYENISSFCIILKGKKRK
jgi:hypothetical protein